MNHVFNTIGILGEPENAGTIETSQALINYLGSRHYRVLVGTELFSQLQHPGLSHACPLAEIHAADLMIVIGGDGSMLRAAHLMHSKTPPLLGINRGRLGFLTDIYPTELNSKLEQVLSGQYQTEERFLLHAQIQQGTAITPIGIALNDVVLTSSDSVKMLEFEISINDEFVCSLRADGLIIATPTGSTAYALSAGGPIVQPNLNAMTLVPMFPHTLTSRPIVIDSQSRVDIHVAHHPRCIPKLSCDGQTTVELPRHATLVINQHPHKLRLIHPLDYNYYDTLRTKLHWGTKL
jgi:NAD+ kinase